MRDFSVILGLFLVVSAYALNVPSDGSILPLRPKAGILESFWQLTTESGSKMVLICQFRTYSCSVAAINLFDGKEISQHCPESGERFRINSFKNKMNIMIINRGRLPAAFCEVKATKPYIDMPEITIDSSEHGRSEKATCGKRNHRVGRIVNGKEAGVNEFPFAGLIIYANNGFPFCGGSIITERHILTAAHCTESVKNTDILVVVGDHDVRTSGETPHMKLHTISAIYRHELYNNISVVADIAILETAKGIEFNNYVGPVCLPTLGKNLVNQYIKVMGWGRTKDKTLGGKSSPVLNHVNLRVIDPEVCKVLYGIDTLNPTQICTYSNEKDSCQGDSGGPLVHPDEGRYVQVALVSFGTMCASTNAGVNTDVAYYMPWIKRQISKCSQPVSVRHM